MILIYATIIFFILRGVCVSTPQQVTENFNSWTNGHASEHDVVASMIVALVFSVIGFLVELIPIENTKS